MTSCFVACLQRIAAFDEPLQINSVRTLNPAAAAEAQTLDAEASLCSLRTMQAALQAPHHCHAGCTSAVGTLC